MRLLLALAVVAAAASADHGQVIHRVLNSWDTSKPLLVLEHDTIHSNRTKNSIPLSQSDTYLPPSKNCQTPGYTGEYCEFPICDKTNYNVPDTPSIGDTAWLDGVQLANCTQSYVILIDDDVHNIRMSLSTNKLVNPQINLVDSNGNSIPYDMIWDETETLFEVIYYILAPGQYSVVPSVDVPTRCNLIVKAQTELTVVGGFTQGDVYSAERNDFPSNIVYFGVPSVLSVHANRNRSPGKLMAVNFVAQQNTVYRPRMLNVRYGCGYEYYFESFTCSVLGEHYFQVEGITFNGFKFRRVVTFDCLPPTPVNSTVAPVTTAPPQPKHCQNGGMMVTNLDGSQYCYCQGLWWGNDCSKILCLNGGTVQSDNTCQCDPSFNGRHCENVYCPDNGDFGFSAEHPTLMLVVRGRKQMNDVINQVQSAVSSYLGYLQFDQNYLTTFILVLFNNKEIIKSERYIAFDDLLSDLKSAQNSFTTDGDCTDSVFTAISEALNLFPNNKSPMYVFTDATPSDASESDTIVHQMSYWRVPINIFYVPTTPFCTLSPDDSTYRTMDTLAKKSMGATFYMGNQTLVQTLTYQHLLTTGYHSQMMLSNDLDSCATQNQYMAVTIDSAVEQLTIIGVGSNLVLTLTPPDLPGQVLTPTFSDGRNFIWVKKGLHTGNWLVSFNGSEPNGPCSFKVLQKGLDTTTVQYPQYDLFWAFTGAVDSDGPTAQPVYGYDLGMTVHLTDYPDYIPPQYIQAGLNIYASRMGIQTEVYASNGIWRDGCSYNFYFPPYRCQRPDETLYFNFYARDQVGMAIQRSGVMTCMQYHATPKPPTDCQNGGVLNPTNSTCYCPAGYTGNHCEKINCFNGGTPFGTQCKCNKGWAGAFCTVPMCTEKGISPEIIRNYVNMIFAVELTSQGYPQLYYLNKYFSELLRDIQSQESTWITNYVLVGYNSTWGGVIHSSPSWNPSGIIHALDQLASAGAPTDTGCTVRLYYALDKAIRERSTPAGSYIQIFQTSPADESDNGGWGELYEYTRELYLTVTGFLAFNPRGPHGYFCNATQADFQLLFDVTGGSSSKVYPVQPATLPEVIKVIPLQYSSGLVYAQWSLDCSTPMQVYFPVDAYTQTIQLTTAGNNTQIQVFDSQGRPVEPFQLMHDPASYWDIWEIRKPCDADWTPIGQYCTRFMTDKMTFDDAHNYCASAGGFIVDDLNQDKHQFLLASAANSNFWIGLKNGAGGYTWDRGTYAPYPMNQTATFWVGGNGPPAYDQNKLCVYWDASQKDGNTWTPDSCATQRPFICQKHRYDQNTPPTSLDSNILPAGKWYVNVNSTTSNVAGGCYAEVRVQSKLQIYTGFTTSMTQDYPNPDPINDSNNNMMITYIHSDDNEHRTPILTHAMLYDAYNGTFYNAAQYEWRYGCALPWLTQPFACPNGQSSMNEFLIAHVGEDEFGNMFQRITLAHCSPKVLTCGNGGYRYNGQCVCDEYWTGKYCTVPMCVNGGTLDPNNDQRCLCPHGYGGPNCQYDECSRRAPYNFTADARTLLLVVEATTQNTNAFKQLANNFNSIVLNAMNKDPWWFKNYALITFDSNGVKYEQYTYTNPAAVQSALMLQSNTINDNGACTTNIYSVLDHALRQRDQIAFPNSHILLVTASGAADYQNRLETIEQLSNSEAILHWLYMSDKCGAQPTDPSVPHLTRLAYASNGNVAFMDGNSLSQFLNPYLASRYNAQVLDNPTVGGGMNLTCDSGNWLVQVDGNTTQIYISSTSMFGTVGVKDPFNQNIAADVLFNVGQTKLYKIDTELSGVYNIKLNSPGSCFVSIYGVGGTAVFSHFAPTSKNDADGSHSDGIYNTPFANTPAVATFHLEGSPGHMGQLQYVEIVQSNQVIRSELYRRTECTWEYYSDPFVCTTDLVRLYIYGMDEKNQQFRRQQLSFCLNGTLPTNEPITDTTPAVTVTTPGNPVITTSTTAITSTTTTTQSTTTSPVTTPTAPPTSSTTPAPILQFDVAFLIDVSSSAKERYDDMANFVSTLMSNFNVGSGGARVALIPVVGDSSVGGNPVAGFNGITSQDLLVKNLQQMKTFWSDFGDDGQYLTQGLAVTTNPSFLADGYRSYIKNHLIIYVTATSAFSDNPSTTAILNANTYGVVVVSTGDQITNQARLTNLAGGAECSFYAANGALLNENALPAVQNLISNAATNGGLYCGNNIGAPNF